MSDFRRRSRSESRKQEKGASPLQLLVNGVKQTQHPTNQVFFHEARRLRRRKTSAELISEAKSSLEEQNAPQNTTKGGVRLVSTRRPITPYEPGRVLYGKVALAGRPPSSFSLKYLRNEGGRHTMVTSLEPIKGSNDMHINEEKSLQLQPFEKPKSRRSNSLDARIEFHRIILGEAPIKVFSRKLPALEVMHKPTAGGNTSKDLEQTKMTLKKQHSLDKFSDLKLLASLKFATPDYDLLAQSSIDKLIELLKEHSGLKDCTEETVNHIHAILLEIYARVRQPEKNFKRAFILGGLYGLVECSSPKILLAVARVVLALRVTGSNLTGACKLIFKVARNEENDFLFYENDLLELLIEGLGRASPLDDPEACIYGYGSLRFLTTSTSHERAEITIIKDECHEFPKKPATAPTTSANTHGDTLAQQQGLQKLSKQNSLVERLARHGAVELMILHLQILNEFGASQQLAGPSLHSLYQLSAALRALADVRQKSCSIEQELNVEGKLPPNESKIQLELACPHLVRSAEISIGEVEVQANIVRTLSLLSENNNCCDVLATLVARIGMLLGPCCDMFQKSFNASEKLLSLLSRLGYILGNIMAKHEKPRKQFYYNDVAMEYLLKVLETYVNAPLTLTNALGDTVVDVLIKTVRVVANMSVDAEVGFGLGNVRALGMLLLSLLKVTNAVNPAKLAAEIEELAHATLGALHNLCFYQDTNATPTQVIESKGCLQSVLPELATVLHETLNTCQDPAIQVEVARVLGNLTRNAEARKSYCKAGGLEFMVQQLSTSPQVEYELKACGIGILVNLLGDNESRTPFLDSKGAEVLCTLLGEALQYEHWFLAAVICQAFWNLFIDAAILLDISQDDVLDDISDLLVDNLDEERLFGENEETDRQWEEFALVATDLLERIQSSYEKESDGATTPNFEGHDDDDEDEVYIKKM